MDEEESEVFTFAEAIESCFFNVVIDFPDQLVPRIRVFVYQDDEDGVKVPYLLYMLADDTQTKPTVNPSFVLSPEVARRYHNAAQPVSEMAIGVAGAATVVYEWAENFQQKTGEPLFPTPVSISQIIMNKIFAEMCFTHGIFYVERNFEVSVSKPEEEYRPGIYL